MFFFFFTHHKNQAFTVLFRSVSHVYVGTVLVNLDRPRITFGNDTIQAKSFLTYCHDFFFFFNCLLKLFFPENVKTLLGQLCN